MAYKKILGMGTRCSWVYPDDDIDILCPADIVFSGTNIVTASASVLQITGYPGATDWASVLGIGTRTGYVKNRNGKAQIIGYDATTGEINLDNSTLALNTASFPIDVYLPDGSRGGLNRKWPMVYVMKKTAYSSLNKGIPFITAAGDDFTDITASGPLPSLTNIIQLGSSTTGQNLEIVAVPFPVQLRRIGATGAELDPNTGAVTATDLTGDNDYFLAVW